MCGIKAFIFDMDGIILDSESISDITWIKASEQMNLPKVKEDVINLCRGTNLNDTKSILKQVYGNDFDSEAFLNLTSELFHQIEFSSGIPLLPYAKESLERLSKEYKIGLASSTKGPTVKRQLTNTGVINYFEKMITGDMVEHSKPNPEIYLKACDSFGLLPSECVAIEDSPNGIKSAYQAGMKVIMIPDKIKPTKEIESMCWKIFDSLKDMTDFIFS